MTKVTIIKENILLGLNTVSEVLVHCYHEGEHGRDVECPSVYLSVAFVGQ